jgi:hypothetical protein
MGITKPGTSKSTTTEGGSDMGSHAAVADLSQNPSRILICMTATSVTKSAMGGYQLTCRPRRVDSGFEEIDVWTLGTVDGREECNMQVSSPLHEISSGTGGQRCEWPCHNRVTQLALGKAMIYVGAANLKVGHLCGHCVLLQVQEGQKSQKCNVWTPAR